MAVNPITKKKVNSMMCRYTIIEILMLAVATVSTVKISELGGKPLMLLEPDETKTQIRLSARGSEFLESLGDDSQVAVLAVVGQSRSGKSFTLNHLLRVDHNDGFGVGHTDSPTTVGAWLWPRLIHAPAPDNFSYIVIDTEGVGGASVSTYDKALAFATAAVSSKVVYHLSGYAGIDDVSKLFGLAGLVEYSRKIGGVHHGSGILPAVSWVLQRYDLERSSATPDQASVLEMVLSERDNPTGNPHIAEYNATVRAVKLLYPSHTIHLIPTAYGPVGKGHQYNRLTDVPPERLSTGFTSEMDSLRSELFGGSAVTPQKRRGPKTGPQILEFLRELIPAANVGMSHAEFRVGEYLVRDALRSAISNMTAELSSAVLPLDEREAAALTSRALSMAIATLNSEAPTMMSDGDAVVVSVFSERLSEAREDVAAAHAAACSRFTVLNYDASEKQCRSAADEAVALLAGGGGGVQSAVDYRARYGGNLAAFDGAADAAIAAFDSRAIGPAAGRLRTELSNRIAEMRSTVSSDGAPRRKAKWIVGSVVVAVCSLMLSEASTRTSKLTSVRVISKTLEITSISAGISTLASIAMLVISAWSLFDDPFVRFEVVADFISGFWCNIAYL